MIEMVIYFGTISKLRFDFEFEKLAAKNKWRWYYIRADKGIKAYIELAPHNKGNLFKVRKYFMGHYEVWYGTKLAAWCSNFWTVENFLKDK